MWEQRLSQNCLVTQFLLHFYHSLPLLESQSQVTWFCQSFSHSLSCISSFHLSLSLSPSPTPFPSHSQSQLQSLVHSSCFITESYFWWTIQIGENQRSSCRTAQSFCDSFTSKMWKKLIKNHYKWKWWKYGINNFEKNAEFDRCKLWEQKNVGIITLVFLHIKAFWRLI